MKIDDRRLEVLRTMLDRPDTELSVSDISRDSGVSQPTVSRIIDELEEGVIETRQEGNMKLVELERRDYVKNVVEAVSDRNRYLEEAAESFATKLSGLEEVEKCILFGSVARGTADFDSDIDVLVLVSSMDARERIMVKSEAISEDTGFQISPTVMKQETYREHTKEETQFSRNVERDKKVLYGKQAS